MMGKNKGWQINMETEIINKLKAQVATIEKSLIEIKSILNLKSPDKDISASKKKATIKAKKLADITSEPEIAGQERILQGVFDGQNMISEDGEEFPVPANYASKSKMVEGDALKLTITEDGSFLYKQIGPVDRKRVVGILNENEDGDYEVIADDRSYKVLLASVTYFKGEVGDKVTVLLPEKGEATWAAIENIIKVDDLGEEVETKPKETRPAKKEIEEAKKDEKEDVSKHFFYGSEIDDI